MNIQYGKTRELSTQKNDRNQDIIINIFLESMNEYLNKLDVANEGLYELDHYDLQVITVA